MKTFGIALLLVTSGALTEACLGKVGDGDGSGGGGGAQKAPVTDAYLDAGPGVNDADAAPPTSDAGAGDDANDTGNDASSDTGIPPVLDAGIVLPPECANPGPFALPSAASISAQFVGTWINCDNSIFTGALPSDGDVGILVRPDGTWQALGESGGLLVNLTMHTEYGQWSTYAGGVNVENVMVAWDTSSLAVDPMFSADGRTMFVTTAAGGNQATLAKAVGTE